MMNLSVFHDGTHRVLYSIERFRNQILYIVSLRIFFYDRASEPTEPADSASPVLSIREARLP